MQYMLKINMSIAIVCMVNNTALKLMSGNSGLAPNTSSSLSNKDECPAALHSHSNIVFCLIR